MHNAKNYNMQEPQFEYAFFKPFVGEKYEAGINDKKVLVIGDSFYCSRDDLTCYGECTSTESKNSSRFDYTCQVRSKNKGGEGTIIPLHDEPSVAIREYKSYSYLNFESFLKLFVGEDEKAWEYVAFTNYIQFFLPGYRTNGAFIDEKNYKAFEEVVSYLKPDIVVTWGNAVADSIRNGYGISNIIEELKDSQYYLAHLTVREHTFKMVYLYHPSSRIWASDIYNSYKYFRKALED